MIYYEYEMLKSIALSVSISSCRPRPTPSQYKAKAEKLPLQCLPNHSKQHLTFKVTQSFLLSLSEKYWISSYHMLPHPIIPFPTIQYQTDISYHRPWYDNTTQYGIQYQVRTDHNMKIPHSMQHNMKLPQTTIWKYHTVWITIWNYHRPQYDNTTQYAAQYQVSCRPLLRLISSSLPPSPPISHQAKSKISKYKM